MTPVDAQAPERGGAVRRDRAPPQNAHTAFVRDSVAGSIWTGVSRVSGFAQSLAVAAVLGATYLGNVYQATNAIPNMTDFQILAGSLFASLVVPPLVNRFDDGDTEGAEHLARSFLGLVLLVSCMLALLLVAASPFLLRIFAADVGIDRTRARRSRSVWYSWRYSHRRSRATSSPARQVRSSTPAATSPWLRAHPRSRTQG